MSSFHARAATTQKQDIPVEIDDQKPWYVHGRRLQGRVSSPIWTVTLFTPHCILLPEWCSTTTRPCLVFIWCLYVQVNLLTRIINANTNGVEKSRFAISRDHRGSQKPCSFLSSCRPPWWWAHPSESETISGDPFVHLLVGSSAPIMIGYIGAETPQGNFCLGSQDSLFDDDSVAHFQESGSQNARDSIAEVWQDDFRVLVAFSLWKYYIVS